MQIYKYATLRIDECIDILISEYTILLVYQHIKANSDIDTNTSISANIKPILKPALRLARILTVTLVLILTLTLALTLALSLT